MIKSFDYSWRVSTALQSQSAPLSPRRVVSVGLWVRGWRVDLRDGRTQRRRQSERGTPTTINSRAMSRFRVVLLHPPTNTTNAVASIQENANKLKGHSLLLAVSYSLCYDLHCSDHSNSTLCNSPVEMLNFQKSYILPHFLPYVRYISDESQIQTLQASLNRLIGTTLHVHGNPTALHTETGILSPPVHNTQ